MKTLLSLAACACLSLVLAAPASAMPVLIGAETGTASGSFVPVSFNPIAPGLFGDTGTVTFKSTASGVQIRNAEAGLTFASLTGSSVPMGSDFLFSFDITGGLLAAASNGAVQINFQPVGFGRAWSAELFAAPVPEPTTMAMLAIGGLVCCGSVVRRRRRLNK